MAESRVTLSYKVGSGEMVKRVVGTGPSSAAALGELTNKAKLMAGVPLKAVETTAIDSGSLPPFRDAGEARDAILVMSSGVDNPSHVVTINSMAYPDFAIAGRSDGKINIAHADIVAFAAAWYDNDGQTGYDVIDGWYK